MWNKAKCILLASNNKKTSIHQIGNSNFIGYSQEDDRYTGRELYIINDDVIKEGWIIGLDDKPHYVTESSKYPKVILATTDKSLVVKYDERFKDITINNNSLNQLLSQIPQSFIEQYITEYNKGNVISDVLVEYGSCNGCIKLQGQLNSPDCCHNYQLVINQDNTINIKTVKDSFNRDEVVECMWKAYKATNTIFEDEESLRLEFDKWITKNL